MRSELLELVVQHGAEVTDVEEARLRIEPRLLLELWHRERAVDEEQRSNGERDQGRIDRPGERDEHAESREDELGREILEREQAGLAQRMAATETQHHREDAVVQEHEDDGGSEAGDSEPELVVRDQTVLLQDVPPDRGRCEQVEEVVARVERLDVPGVANLQPLRNVLGHHDGRQEPRREAGERPARAPPSSCGTTDRAASRRGRAGRELPRRR